MTDLRRFSFGENDSFYYEFKLHVYSVPGKINKITTVMMSSTNLRNKPSSSIDPYIPDLIQFLAKLCVENNASYDAFHNYLIPYSRDDSANIAKNVNQAINSIQSQSSLYNIF